MVVPTYGDAKEIKGDVFSRGITLMISTFISACAFEVELPEVYFLEGVNPILVRDGWRNKSFFPNGRKITFSILNSISRAPAISFGLDSFQPAFKTFICKDGSNFARPFKFCMFVIGKAAKKLNFFNDTVQLYRGVKVNP